MKGMLSARSIVVAAKDQVSSDLGSEVAILDLSAGTYYGLNEVGARIWELIQEPRAVSDVRDTLVSEYAVDATRCEGDLLALLERLCEEGLVDVEG